MELQNERLGRDFHSRDSNQINQHKNQKPEQMQQHDDDGNGKNVERNETKRIKGNALYSPGDEISNVQREMSALFSDEQPNVRHSQHQQKR